MRLGVFVLAWSVGVSGIIGVAEAESSQVTPVARRGTAESEPKPAADGYVSQAQQLFKEQRFSDAAEALKQAFDLQPNPLFLFNAGQAYRKALWPLEAKAMYERFVEVAPSHQLVPEAKGYIQTLAILIEERQAKQKAELTLLEKQGELQEKQTELQEKQSELQEQVKKREEAQRDLERVKNPPIYRKPWFWAVMSGAVVGVGVVLVGVLVTSYRFKTDGGLITVSY